LYNDEKWKMMVSLTMPEEEEGGEKCQRETWVTESKHL
jgi:hypothetical protein